MSSSPADAESRSRLVRFLVTAVSVIALLTGSHAAHADDSIEYRVKAAYLHKFLQFVEWPSDAPLSQRPEFVIGVVSDRSFEDSIDRLNGLQAKGHTIELRRVRRTEDIDSCSVVFVARDAESHAGEILERAHGRSILTVGESEAFAKSGGVVNFYLADETVRFEINVDAAERARLGVSSRLLRLARIVREEFAEAGR